MNTSMESLSIEIESTAKESTGSVDRLIQQLDKLRTSLQNVINESTNFSKLKSNLESVGKGVSTKASAKAASPSVPYERQLFEANLKYDPEEDLSGYYKLKNEIKSLDSTTTSYIGKQGELVTVSRKGKDELEKVRVTVKRTGEESKTASNNWKKLTSSFTFSIAKIAVVYAGLSRLASKVADFVKEAGNYEEALNLFTVTMGENAEKATQWVNKFSDALYLDPSSVMQYMGSFNSLVKGLGLGADKSYIMSKNLTQLTYDLASFKNLSFDEAFRKLQSATSGEIEPLRNVGVALSQNTLQELANSMGIEQRVAEMSEANKAQLRYIQILKSTGDWQTDMGRTLVTPANALRILQQQFILLKRAIGSVFIPIVMKLIPYVMVLTKALTALAQRIADFLGYKIQDIDYSRIADGFGDIAGGIEDVGDEAAGAAKKLNTMLAPFDELNVVQNQAEKNGKGSGLGGVGDLLDLPLPEYDALAGLNKQLADQMKDAEKNIKRLIPLVKALGIAFASWKIGKGVFNILSWFGGKSVSGTSFKDTKKGIKELSEALKVSPAGLGGIVASLTATFVALGIEIPKVWKTLGTLYKSRDITKVGDQFNWFDKILLNFLGNHIFNNEIGQIGLGLTSFVKSLTIGYDMLFGKIKLGKGTMDALGDSISKASKTKLTPLIEQFDILDSKMLNLDIGNKIVTQKDIVTVQSTLSQITNSIINELDVDKNKQLKNLKTLEKTLGFDKTQELLNKAQEYYDKQTSIVETNSARITEIMQNASDNNRQLTQEETTEIRRLRDEMYDTGIKAATKNSDEYYKVMATLKDNTTKLAVEQGSEIIKQAVKTRDKTIKAAEDQYATTVGEALKMKEAGIINDEEYKKIRDAAAKTRDETIESAKTQYDEIYDTTKEKLGDTGKVIDKETGEIKSNWQVFWDGLTYPAKSAASSIATSIGQKMSDLKTKFGNKLGELKTIANVKLQELRNTFSNWKATLKTPHIQWQSNGTKTSGALKKILQTLNLPTSLPKLSVSWYAEGGFPRDGEFFVANENGPEMVGKIGNRSAVANNDQIETSLTNALITALNNYDFGGGKSPTTIYIGNKKVYEGYGDYVNGENDRYGTNTIRI